MKMDKPELLSPVGGFPQLIAAVENGADAVYMGGGSYNARMFADNFESIEEVEKAVDYAHLRNVKVYITLNTLLNDIEINEVINYARKLYEIGVDAVIVQDLGLVDLLSKEVPNLKVHISTQATIYSKDGVNLYKKYKNVERVVLARELSLQEIKDIVQNVNTEIEIFVHGALCVCYSGQCKLSSMIGARSGNRGKCAQPCRLPYKIEKLEEKENYYLSTKDVCLIDILPSVINTGVKSLKIEGRMKSPEYVAAVTKIYRKYIDIVYDKKEYVVDENDREILLQVFNRGGFSTGYLQNSDSKEIWCNARPKNCGIYLGKVLEYNCKKKNIKIKLEKDITNGDVIEIVNKDLTSARVSYIKNASDIVKEAEAGEIVTLGDIKGKIEKGEVVYKIISKKLNDNLKESFSQKSIKKNNAKCEIELKIGNVPKLKVSSNILDKEFEVTVNGEKVCELGKNKCITKENIKENLAKTNDIPFRVSEIKYNIDDNVFTSVANLNNLRKKAFETLSNKIISSFKNKEIIKIENKIIEKILRNKKVQTKLSAYVYRLALLKKLDVLTKFDRVYISLEDSIKYETELKKLGIKDKIYIYFPTVTNTKYREYINQNIDKIIANKNILASNVEHLEMFKEKGLNISLDNSFNVFNSSSLETLSKIGKDVVSLSNELSLAQIENILSSNHSNVEVDVYGNLQVMYSNFCILKANGKCGLCKKISYNLVDRKGKRFPCLFNNIGCTMQVLNSDKLFSKEAVNRLYNKVDYMRLYIYNETEEEITKVIENIKGMEKNEIVSDESVKYTNGHFFREV